MLRADPQLAAAVPESTLDAAASYAFAPARWLERGEWRPELEAGDAAGSLGLLVLDGFLVRQVRVIDRPAAELFGPGDLLHPWEPDHTEPFAAGAHWEVLEAAHVAVLDRRFCALAGRFPELVAALFGRAIARSRGLLLNLAIGQLVGIEMRLLVLLWHIAEHWGERQADGSRVVPVRLTHQLIASLISAQRPTVTSALAALTSHGLVSRRPDGLIVVHGEAPTEFRRLRSALP
ncbi:MAG: family transcriptional regulator, cyclic receptor protein [Solirubrobacteraceae bacterium]|nr:family transcriptional regulator, cyclic receptor protein [Solirubrobacteraceae bacterium]MEA2288144.1 family transcriptional regulator, cyclic receptor protein [Solirubrobacteraceae bacterium]